MVKYQGSMGVKDGIYEKIFRKRQKLLTKKFKKEGPPGFEKSFSFLKKKKKINILR